MTRQKITGRQSATRVQQRLDPAYVLIDELTPIARYIAQEMNANPQSQLGQKLKQLNSDESERSCLELYKTSPELRQATGFQPRDCAAVGLKDFYMSLMLWKKKVGTNCHWDHKPKIKQRAEFWSRSTGSCEWHVYRNTAYCFDCWSNIHYGYVGASVGFARYVLLDGAGAAQFLSDLQEKGIWPKGSGDSWLPRRWDRTEDRIAIALGYKLYQQMPINITPEVLVQAVITTQGLLTRTPEEVRDLVKNGYGVPHIPTQKEWEEEQQKCKGGT